MNKGNVSKMLNITNKILYGGGYAKKVLCVFLSIVLVVGLFPNIAFASESSTGAQSAESQYTTKESSNSDSTFDESSTKKKENVTNKQTSDTKDASLADANANDKGSSAKSTTPSSSTDSSASSSEPQGTVELSAVIEIPSQNEEPDYVASGFSSAKLSYEAGTFPKNVKLVVAEATGKQEEAASEAVDVKRAQAGAAGELPADAKNVAKRAVFEVKVVDVNDPSIEYQPDASKPAPRLSFELASAEALGGADAVCVYHVADPNAQKSAQGVRRPSENLDALKADKVESEKKDETVTAEAGAFSYYSVDFTYGDKTFSIPGDAITPLSEIMAPLGIKGQITEAYATQDAGCNQRVADGQWVTAEDGTELFCVYNQDNTWYVESKNPFTTHHGLVVKTADGLQYGGAAASDGTTHKVAVTDDANVMEVTFNGTTTVYTSHGEGWNAAAVTSGTSRSTPVQVKLLADWDGDGANGFGNSGAGLQWGFLDVPANVHIELDLNGCNIDRHCTAMKDNNFVLFLRASSSLTVKSTAKNADGTVKWGEIRGGWSSTSNSCQGGGISTSSDKDKSTNCYIGLLEGARVTGNKATQGGGVVLAASGSSLLIDGGEVVGNEAIGDKNTGGVAITGSNITAEMKRGKIDNNTSTTSVGGMHVFGAGSTFTMSGGSISGNRASGGHAGGVYCANGGTFTMNGGTISGNTTTTTGGGVHINPDGAWGTGMMVMTGGTVANNTAGTYGAGIYDGNSLTVGGTAVVEGNTDAATNGDVYLPSGKTIKVSSDTPLTTGARIGVLTANTPSWTSPLDLTPASYSADYSGYFFANNEKYGCYNSGTGSAQKVVLDYKRDTRVSTDGGDNWTWYSFPKAWDAACEATGTEDIPVKIQMTDDFNAGGTFSGKATHAATWGSLQAGKMCYIDIDLNGCTLSRGCTGWTEGGYIVDMANGEQIALRSTNGTGKATGGFNSYHSEYQPGETGGIGLHSGTLIIAAGASIEGNFANYACGGVFAAGSSSHVILDGGSVSRNYGGYQGGGVQLNNQATLEIRSGNICENYCYGGGTYVQSSGAGVFLNGGSSATMSDGQISGNYVSNTGAYYGAGAAVSATSTFTMTGGTISGNTAPKGGGIYIDSNCDGVTMTGGTVTGNTATSDIGAGIYADKSGVATFGGTAVVEGNTDAATKGDLYLPSGNTFNVSSTTSLTTGARIGVLTQTDPTTISTVTIATSGVTESCKGYFFADKGDPWGVHYVVNGSANSLVIGQNAVEVSTNGGSTWTSYLSHVTGWNAAINAKGTAEQPVKVKLLADWSATGGSLGNDGHVKGYIACENSACIDLDLNGRTINRGLTQWKAYGYVIINVATLTVCDSSSAQTGTIKGGYDGYGSGINNSGTLILASGTISGNTASNSGGGVYVSSGTFTMTGGAISGNTSGNYGGGIYLAGGTFNMSGGYISANTATFGGGVEVAGGTFTMTGGTISDNTATDNAGGICLDGGSTSLLSGKITGNKALNPKSQTGNWGGGGVCCYLTDVTVGGKLVVEDNTEGSGSSEAASDIKLVQDHLIAVSTTTPLEEGAKIGVLTQTNPSWTSVVDLTPALFSADYSGYFFANNKKYGCYNSGTGSTQKVVLDYKRDTGVSTDGGVNWTWYHFPGAWDAAVDAVGTSEKPVKIKMTADFDAGGTFYNKAKYADQYGYLTAGRMCYIDIDLNGRTLDRGCDDWTVYGLLINMSNGEQITFSSSNDTGKVTGGRNGTRPSGSNDYGPWLAGGICLQNGTLTIASGASIEGNYANYAGGGVFAQGGSSHVILNGGSVSGNYGGHQGGGVLVN